jgi:serine/threonine-protein kinase
MTTPSAPDDETRLGPEVRRSSAKSPSTGGTTSGWLSSSGSIDHGRFDPGTVLGSRYRIIGRLGRGGMGEVYRADDLKLGQPVALKFLPADVDRDPARLSQLHAEVRMARQVSHPNVCRVYDIDEEDGHTFLSMEYVDGEDLASLLRRIGRFPEERGLAIARQVCAGLAAAHERGVVHRDFKPANVMIDGSGTVRITDFGLAGVTGESLRAGTPAYMAPEQLAGGEVTARSDIYALGLVLYEIFTGQRALEGGNLAELIHKREQSGITPPSAHVRDLAPEIEQTILRCLRPDPAQRPATALAVAAALPGGDPLAAALAAGETPSPEMVAAAGGTSVISIRTAVAATAWLVLSIVALVTLYERVMLVNRVPAPKTPAALQDRAAETLAKLGYADPPAASAWGLGFSQDYARYLAGSSSEADRWEQLRRTRPESLVLWYRTSPRPLVPFGSMNPVAGTNPPLTVSGMTLVILDASGRLAEFIAVPPPVEADGGPTTATNWHVLFEAAGLDISTFTPSTPTVVPPVHAHERAAWEGRFPEVPEHPIRVEAAAFSGKPVYFVTRGPWSRSARSLPPPTTLFSTVTAALEAFVVPALMLAGAVLARRNVKLGRGDRRGAFRVATSVFILLMAAWVLRRHVLPPAADLDRFFTAMGGALFNGAVLWLTYLGLEPYVRRHAPDSLIGWTRLVAGDWRDPRVGADVMIGVSAGLAMTLFYAVHNVIPPLLDWPMPQPLGMDVTLLAGTREVLAYLCGRIAAGIQGAMLCVVGYVALRLLLTRSWLAIAATIALFTPVAINGMFPPGTPILDLILGAGLISVFVAVIVRSGLLATTAALTTHFVLLRAPLTTDLASWRAATAFWFLAAVAVAGFGSVYVARSGVVRGARSTANLQTPISK